MTRFTRTNTPPDFYTYAYLREDGRPYYVGKGGGTNPQRAWQSHGSAKKRWQPPSDEYILFLKWGMTEDEAHNHEIYMIAVFGNHYVEGGWLSLNFTDGGEGTSGYQYTDELRVVRAEQLKGNDYGSRVDWTPELRQKLSAATTGIKKTKTDAVIAHHRDMARVHEWRHDDYGVVFASSIEMSRRFDVSQSSMNRLSLGRFAQVKGWTCVNPVEQFVPAVVDHDSRISRAAATRTAKNAAQLGMTVEEYKALSYNQRSRLRKERGLKGLAA
jgi:hypothetical protein